VPIEGNAPEVPALANPGMTAPVNPSSQTWGDEEVPEVHSCQHCGN